MKKIIIVLAFTLISLNAMALDLWVKGGIMEGVGSKKIKNPGYTAGFELSQGILGFADLGVGTTYNGNLKFNDGTENVQNVGFDIVPVYAFAKFNIIPIAIKPYVVARVGRSFVVNDGTDYNHKIDTVHLDKAGNGFYGAAGVGIELMSTLEAELLYSISEVKNNPSGKDHVEMISLTLGYNFF